MIYDIYKDGTLVNTIVANEDFVVPYCRENGYTYTERAAQTLRNSQKKRPWNPASPTLKPLQKSCKKPSI